MKKILLYFIAVYLFSINGQAQQCMLTPLSLNQRVTNGSLIVEAKVIDQKSFWNPEHTYIFTSNLVEIYKVFKGNTVATQAEVITEGGEVGLTRQVVDPALSLQAGQTGVFMLNTSSVNSQFGKSTYSVYSDLQGFINYEQGTGVARDPFTTYSSVENELFPAIEHLTGQTHIDLQPTMGNSQKVNNTNSVAATISSFSPSSITAGTASSLTITGVGFGASQSTSYVEFPDADAGAGYIQPHSSQYLSWSNTQIVVQVPTKTTSGGTLTTSGTAGTGQFRVVVAGSPTLSPSSLTINYGHLNVYFSNTLTPQQVFNTRHVDLNGMGGITWQMFTGFDAMAAPKAAFQRAFQSWRCATLIDWALGAPVATNTIGFDGVDVIRFDVGAELPGGVLGRCTSYFSGCITSGTLVSFYVSELDICFDDATTWQYGPAAPTGAQYDFESVTLHELGHGHQLSHVINTLDVMHYSIANAQSKRVLNVDDVNGGNAVMTRNLSGGVCLKPIMVALSPTACAAGSPTVAFNMAPSATICAGQSITLTDASVGTPTSWSWTLTGGAPATSTVQNPVVTYATPGTYSITLVSTNGFGSSTPLTKTVSVLGSPTVGVTGTSTICSGFSAVVTATGATSYTWNPGGLTGATQTLSPGVTTAYTVTGSNGVCSSSSAWTLSVSTTPTVAVNSATICGGSSATLNATGASTYTWNPGGLTGPTQVFTPTITTTYTVTGANGSCTNVKTVTVTVLGTPTVVATNGGPFCAGSTITLFCTAATSYTWIGPGGFTAITQNPTITNCTLANAGNYTVIVTVGTCTASAVTSVIVNALPAVTVNNTGPYCPGNTILLSSSAASSYTWSGPGAFSSNSQNPTRPAATTTMSGVYTVTVSNGAGCKNTATTSVVVNPTPTPTATSNSPVCAGLTLSLTALGGTGYSWSGPLGFTSPLSNPIITNVTSSMAGVYTVTVTAATSCTAVATTSVSVTPSPTIAVTSSTAFICSGQNATLTASGATTYTFNPGGITTNPAVVNPAATVLYTVSGTSGGCTSSTTKGLTVTPTPTVTASASPTLICVGVQSSTLTGAGATSYIWNPGNFSGNNIPTTLSLTTQFTVTGTSGGCSANALVTVSVTSCTGINEISANGFNLYPNPTQGNITIDLGTVSSGKILVYNALGQEIMSKNVSEIELLNIDLSAYSKGMYFVNIRIDGRKDKMIKVLRE